MTIPVVTISYASVQCSERLRQLLHVVACVTDRTGDLLHHPHQRLRAPNSSADDLTRPVTGCHVELSLVINQSINQYSFVPA